MSKMITYMLGLTLLLVGAVAFVSCEDNPVRPKGPQRPACWKPLVSMFGTPGNADAAPAWSPSGEFLLYHSHFDSCNDRNSALYITDSTGRPKSRLAIEGSIAKWLPGDSLIIVNTGLFIGGELVIHNINSDSTTPLGIYTQTPIFDVSEDGRYLYYEDTLGWIVEHDRMSSSVCQLIEFGGGPSISPDRSQLVYAAGELHIFDLKDSSDLIIRPDGGTSDWTPDGSRIVYSDGIGKLFATDLSGNTIGLIGQHDLNGAFGPLSVHPNGQSVIFRKLSVDNFVHLWQINLDGTGLREFSR